MQKYRLIGTMMKNGVYAKLWAHQSGGFLAEDDSHPA